MAANRRSLAVTDAYRRRFEALTDRAQAVARSAYRLDLEDLDGSYEPYLSALVATVTQAQTEGVRLSSAYLAAYASSELGRRVSAPTLASADYAGLARDGRPLSEVLVSPLIGVKGALKRGEAPAKALKVGLDRALLAAEMDTAHAARQSLLDGIAADNRFDGWRRAIRGTCGACAAKASGTENGLLFQAHPGCFPAGVEVAGPSALAASKRWHSGDLIELRFRRGGFLACTPNHPILTPGGWVAADKLSEGHDVVRSSGKQGSVASVGPDDDERPALIEEVAEALRGSGEVTTRTVPTSPEDFHGDGAYGNGYVDVVAANGLLERDRSDSILQEVGQVPLCARHSALIALTRGRHLAALFLGMLATRSRTMSGLGVAAILLGGAFRQMEAVGVSAAPDFDAGLFQGPTNRDASHPVPTSQGLLRHAGLVETDQLVKVGRRPFSGHVFNLQTVGSWYISNGVIVSNCKCVSEPEVSGVPNLFPRPTGAEVMAAKSPEEQDDALGPEAAEAFRNGLPLEDLIGHSPMENEPDWLTQRPLDAVAA